MDKQQLAGLSDEEQRALLAKILQKKTVKLKKKPLSFAQERLWFLYQLNPDNTANNPFNAFRLSGALNTKMLEECFNQVVARHEVLRTTFTTLDGNATQVIAPSLELNLPLIDLANTPSRERQAVIERMAAEDAQRPFDLTRGPLVRITLLRLDHTEHILFLIIHHIVSDGWSAGVLLHEMLTFYKARLAGNSQSPFPALPLQYADFAVWQRDWLQGEKLEVQRTYWQKQLQNLSALELPTDHERPQVTSVRGATFTQMLNPKLTDELKSLSQGAGVSLFMLLLAAFTALLYRYSGQTDVVVRTPIANRMRQELEALIGYFTNTLALRADLSGEPTFRELLARVGEMCRTAFEHQDIPFEKILEDLHLAQRAGGRQGPLFPVMFILQNMPLPLPDVPGLQLESIELEGGLAPFELTLALREVKGGIRCRLNCATDLFKKTSMERMARHFEQLLQQAVAEPDRGLASLLECIPVEEIPAVHMQAGHATEYVAPRTPLEETLAEIWKEVLNTERVGIYDNFFASGGDSLQSMQLLTLMKEKAGLYPAPRQFMQHPTIAGQAELAASAPATPLLVSPYEIITGLVPLTPPQVWFFRTFKINPRGFSLTVCVETDQPLDIDLLLQTLRYLLAHHDILRARFISTEQGWQQMILSPDEVNPFLSIYDFSALPLERYNESTIQVALELQHSFDFSHPPLIQAAYLNLGPQSPARVLVCVHHLVMDGFSMDILLKDLQSIYMQLSAGQPVSLLPKTTSFKTYAENLLHYARTVALHELDHWLHLPWELIKPLPMDHAENLTQDTCARIQVVQMELDVADTQALFRSIKAQASAHVQITDFLLTAMALALKQWKGMDVVWIAYPGTGRSAPLDHLDLSRTVGFMGTPAHFLLDIRDATSPMAALNIVKQQINATPAGGLGYELLTFLVDDAQSAEAVKPILAIPKPHVFFNYLGHMYSSTQNSLQFRQVSGLPLQDLSMAERADLRTHTLEIIGMVRENSLSFKFLYGPDVFNTPTIETLMVLYRQNLLALIKDCQP